MPAYSYVRFYSLKDECAILYVYNISEISTRNAFAEEPYGRTLSVGNRAVVVAIELGAMAARKERKGA